MNHNFNGTNSTHNQSLYTYIINFFMIFFSSISIPFFCSSQVVSQQQQQYNRKNLEDVLTNRHTYTHLEMRAYIHNNNRKKIVI